jgi:hypothetical protein
VIEEDEFLEAIFLAASTWKSATISKARGYSAYIGILPVVRIDSFRLLSFRRSGRLVA